MEGVGWAGTGWEVAAPWGGDISTLAGKGVACLGGAMGRETQQPWVG